MLSFGANHFGYKRYFEQVYNKASTFFWNHLWDAYWTSNFKFHAAWDKNPLMHTWSQDETPEPHHLGNSISEVAFALN